MVSWKLLPIPLIVAGAIAVPITIVSVSGPKGYTTGVYNYVDYISDDAKASIIDSGYSYREFGDLPEIETAIASQKIPWGVGSDYYNIKLANLGLIQKVDYNHIFDGQEVKTTSGQKLLFSIENPLKGPDLDLAVQNLVTEPVWRILSSFDKLLNDGSKAYEYMIPYFVQNKVVAINPWKVKNSSSTDQLNILRGFDQQAIQNVFAQDSSYKGIFTKLRQLGFKGLSVNNYMRDNLMIGSEESGFTGKINSISEASAMIDGFDKTIHTYDDINFIDSGFDTLMSLHSHSGDEIDHDTALLYNGDTLDAFLGFDQDEDEDYSHNAQIRYILPKNPTFLLDGVIIPTYIKNNELEKVYNSIRSSLYKNVNIVDDDKVYDDEGNVITFNMAFNNFDFVNYTTPFRNLYDLISTPDAYFSEFSHDNDGNDEFPADPNWDLTGSGEYAGNIFSATNQNVSAIDENHVTYPIDINLQGNVETLYNKRFINN